MSCWLEAFYRHADIRQTLLSSWCLAGTLGLPGSHVMCTSIMAGGFWNTGFHVVLVSWLAVAGTWVSSLSLSNSVAGGWGTLGLMVVMGSMAKMAGTLVGLIEMYGWLLEHWFSQQWYYCSSMTAGTNTGPVSQYRTYGRKSCGSGRMISVVTMMILVVWW